MLIDQKALPSRSEENYRKGKEKEWKFWQSKTSTSRLNNPHNMFMDE